MVIMAVLLYLVSTMTAVSGALLATSGSSEVKTFSCRGITLKLLSRYWRCVKVRILEDPGEALQQPLWLWMKG
jgi:hypothetical protein